MVISESELRQRVASEGSEVLVQHRDAFIHFARVGQTKPIEYGQMVLRFGVAEFGGTVPVGEGFLAILRPAR